MPCESSEDRAVMVAMASPEVALENLLLAAHKAALVAKADGNVTALMAYFDVLEVGLSEAKGNNVTFASSDLRDLDPYSLLL